MLDEDEDQPSASMSARKIPVDVWLIPTASFTAGSILGFSRGARMSGLRFLAENAHRLPTTVGGWYFYNKTKNYRVLLGGFKGAARQGLRFGAIGGCWVGVEQSWLWTCEVLGAPEPMILAKEVIAGTVTAGTVSAFYRLPRRTATRTVAMGAVVGAVVSALRSAQRILAKREEGDPAETPVSSDSAVSQG